MGAEESKMDDLTREEYLAVARAHISDATEQFRSYPFDIDETERHISRALHFIGLAKTAAQGITHRTTVR